MNLLSTLLSALKPALQWLLLYLRKQPSMPQEPAEQTQTEQTPAQPAPAPVDAPKYLWDTPENARHSLRVICDEEGLTWNQKNDLCATVHCESGFNPECVNRNMVNGHLSSTDYGICQINDYWHIGPGKDFPSVEYVLNNPEACVRWMCKMWKAGEAKMWVCYLKNMYLNY